MYSYKRYLEYLRKRQRVFETWLSFEDWCSACKFRDWIRKNLKEQR